MFWKSELIWTVRNTEGVNITLRALFLSTTKEANLCEFTFLNTLSGGKHSQYCELQFLLLSKTLSQTVLFFFGHFKVHTQLIKNAFHKTVRSIGKDLGRKLFIKEWMTSQSRRAELNACRVSTWNVTALHTCRALQLPQLWGSLVMLTHSHSKYHFYKTLIIFIITVKVSSCKCLGQ